MPNPFYSISELPKTSQDAIREFDDRYIAAIGSTPPSSWADLGDMFPTSSPMLTLPISTLALRYQKTEGESRFRGMLEKSMDLKVEELDEGIEAKLTDLLTQSYAYRQWQSGPSRLMEAEAQLRTDSLAALLEAGESTVWGASLANPSGVDGVNFFSASHLCNPMDAGSTTWSNYQSVGADCLDVAVLKSEIAAMQGVLDVNGRKMGIDPDTIIVPTAKYEALKFVLAQAIMLDSTGVAGVTNPYTNRLQVVHARELTDVNDFYLVDSRALARGLPPFFSMRWTTPNPALSLRYYDESSDFFKDTGRIKVSSHIWYGFGLAFPHAIRKVKGA